MKKVIICYGVSAAILTGCAIRPVPEDMTRYSTVQIVAKVRCEIQEALRDRVALLLATHGSNPTTKKYGKQFKAGEISAAELRAKSIPLEDQWIVERVNYFSGTSIAYEFDFNITENNKGTADATLNVPFTNGNVSIFLKAGQEHKRQNVRNAKFEESFGDLAAALDQGSSPSLPGSREYCHALQKGPTEDFVYPITGDVGIAELVDSFVALQDQINDVRTKADAPLRKTTSFIDTLTFTSKFVGQVKPTIKLNPISTDSVDLAQANVDLNADRTDVHKLKLSLSPPQNWPPKDPAPEVEIVVAKVGNAQLVLKSKLPKAKTARSKQRRSQRLQLRDDRSETAKAAGRVDARSQSDAQRLLDTQDRLLEELQRVQSQ